MFTYDGVHPLRLNSLTPRQAEVLAFLREYATRRGYPPSVREIGERLGIRSSNGVQKHLNALARKGAIVRTAGVARGIRVVEGIKE